MISLDQYRDFMKKNYIILLICLITLMICSLTLLRLGIERENTAKYYTQLIKVRGCEHILSPGYPDNLFNSSNDPFAFQVPNQSDIIYP